MISPRVSGMPALTQMPGRRLFFELNVHVAETYGRFRAFGRSNHRPQQESQFPPVENLVQNAHDGFFDKTLVIVCVD
jgi:hypothetical protein